MANRGDELSFETGVQLIDHRGDHARHQAARTKKVTIQQVNRGQRLHGGPLVTRDALVSGENDTPVFVDDRGTLDALQVLPRTLEEATPNGVGVKTVGVASLCRETREVIGERHMSMRENEYPNSSGPPISEEFIETFNTIQKGVSSDDPTKWALLKLACAQVNQASQNPKGWTGIFYTFLHQTWLHNKGFPIEAYSCRLRMVVHLHGNESKCKKQQEKRKEFSHWSFFTACTSDNNTLLVVTVEIDMWPTGRWEILPTCNERGM